MPTGAAAVFELSLMCPEDRVEVLSEALEALDAVSVSVEDADAQTPAEQALFGEPGMPLSQRWADSRIAALFDSNVATEDIEALWQTLRDGVDGEASALGPHEFRIVPETDWVRATQAQQLRERNRAVVVVLQIINRRTPVPGLDVIGAQLDHRVEKLQRDIHILAVQREFRPRH